MNDVRTAVGNGDGVCQRLGARLEAEGNVDVADGVPLSVHRADGHAPIVRVGARQLRDVIGDFTSDVGLLLPIHVVDFGDEIGELWQDELAPQRAVDETHVVLNDVAKGGVVQLELLEVVRVLNLHDVMHGLS